MRAQVAEVFITMSGFSSATLASFHLPYVCVTDAQTGMQLFTYHLEVVTSL